MYTVFVLTLLRTKKEFLRKKENPFTHSWQEHTQTTAQDHHQQHKTFESDQQSARQGIKIPKGQSRETVVEGL
jgi:hypothetical protein